MFRPAIILFTCNHNPYGALQLLGINRISYPSSYIPVRVACAGDISTGLLLKTFQKGADGIVVLGCPGSECHHKTGNRHMEHTVSATCNLLTALGIQPGRLSWKLVSCSDYKELHKFLEDFHREIKKAGPSPLRKTTTPEKGEPLVQSSR